MDVVLEQLMEYVDKIAGLVSDAAPMVWEMLLKQVQVEIAGHIIALVVGIGFIVGASKSIKPIKAAVANQRSYDGNEFWYILTAIGYIAGLLMTTLNGYAAIARLINPAWYAIRLLIYTAQ